MEINKILYAKNVNRIFNLDGIRTRNRWIRSPTRYPIAPQGHILFDAINTDVYFFVYFFIDSRRRDSNSRPPAYKAGAMTTMLLRHKNVTYCLPEVGFEPTHPKITELKSAALDHSAIQALVTLHYSFFFIVRLK